jgi:hypothetical protein
MADLCFFRVDEDGAGSGAATFGGKDVAASAGGALEGGGSAGAVTIEATAEPRALGGEALAL